MATKAEKPKVPRGWRIVKRGYVHPGDKLWDELARDWCETMFSHAGDPVSEFHAVIRREGKARAS